MRHPDTGAAVAASRRSRDHAKPASTRDLDRPILASATNDDDLVSRLLVMKHLQQDR